MTYPPADVLVLTALAVEHEALLSLNPRAWKKDVQSNCHTLWRRRLKIKGHSRRLNMAAVCVDNQGMTSTQTLATELVRMLKPKYLAMTGVCAGNPGRTEIGRVVFARKLHLLSSRETTKDGIKSTLYISHDGPFPLSQRWENLARRAEGFIVGEMATGNSNVRDPTFWEDVAKSFPNIAAYDMESAAIGHVAHTHGIDAFVLKGVMDYADGNKNDAHKKLAARASARALLGFLTTPEVADALEPRLTADQSSFTGADPTSREPHSLARSTALAGLLAVVVGGVVWSNSQPHGDSPLVGANTKAQEPSTTGQGGGALPKTDEIEPAVRNPIMENLWPEPALSVQSTASSPKPEPTAPAPIVSIWKPARDNPRNVPSAAPGPVGGVGVPAPITTPDPVPAPSPVPAVPRKFPPCPGIEIPASQIDAATLARCDALKRNETKKDHQ
jgi:nucleoside phosphorylase